MNTNDLIILNFEEVRRRSEKVWRAIPEEMLQWRPDENALSCAEMIRHVLEGEFLYHQILIDRGSKALTLDNISNPFEERAFTAVDDELEFAQQYRNKFMKYIKTISANDLENIEIDRSDVGYVRKLGDMLLRIAYHESVHTGQLLSYMRTMEIDRPKIWD
ncbi:DinB family protein [Oceanobacillus sp. CFH 90083]|uniref:DinB family protein n=1 Tax=Oceanobacillus sp. CFH 90083 TaxID=2592336 RepID=UPI00128BF106|nr:DinB family protein [Oceanobacillus sp. CFH 90083]